MKPRIVWRVLLPVTALWFTIAAISWGGWQVWLGCAVLWMKAAQAYREYIRVDDGVIYQRGLWRWSEPLRLKTLDSVCFHRVWGFREPYKYLEITLATADSHRLSITLRWWSQTEELLQAVAAAVLDPAADACGHRRWRIPVDDETNRRLAHYT